MHTQDVPIDEHHAVLRGHLTVDSTFTVGDLWTPRVEYGSGVSDGLGNSDAGDESLPTTR